MEDLTKYLSNPLESGVYFSQLIVDFSSLNKLFRDLAKKVKGKTESKKLIKTAESLEGSPFLDFDEIRTSFIKALEHYVELENCPNEVKEYLPELQYPFFLPTISGSDRALWYAENVKIIWGSSHRPLRSFRVLTSHTLHNVNDVIDIEKQSINEPYEFLFGLTTTKKEGISTFHNFIKCIPHIGKTVKEIRNRKTYSSRYAFRPYPLAVQLWLGHEKSTVVSKDLKDFLSGSIRYRSEEEWRTSIVLSAIAVESVLADLYEEKNKEYAPNVPLGELYHKVKDQANFPQHIMNAIEMVNEARISAVHRSRFPVSDREATNALYGATTFIMWYTSNY